MIARLAHRLVEHFPAPLAALLGPVHGGVGVTQQLVGPFAAGCGERDADAGTEELLLAFQEERLLHHFEEPLGHLDGLVAGSCAGEILAQHGELVAAETRHRVTGPQDAAQSFAERHEQRVAGVVAEAVVDELEPVEVEEQHRDGCVVTPGAREGEHEELEEQRAIRKSGQRVVMGLVRELSLELFALDRDARQLHGHRDEVFLLSCRRDGLVLIHGDRAAHPIIAGRDDRHCPAGSETVRRHELAGAIPKRIVLDVGDDDLFAAKRGPAARAGIRSDDRAVETLYELGRQARRRAVPQRRAIVVEHHDGAATVGYVRLDHMAQLGERVGERRAFGNRLQDPRLVDDESLGPTLLGDVAPDGLVLDDLSVLVEHRTLGPLLPADTTVVERDSVLDHRDRLVGAQRAQRTLEPRAILFGHPRLERRADERLDGRAEEARVCLVDERHRAVSLEPADQIRLVLDDPAIPIFARAHPRLGLAVLRDVTGRDDKPADGGNIREIPHDGLEMSPAAVDVSGAEFHRLRFVGSVELCPYCRAHTGAIVGMHVRVRIGLIVISRDAEDLLDRRTAPERMAHGIDDRDHLGEVLDQRTKTLLVRAQRLLGVALLGDIARRDHDALDGRLIEQVVGNCFDHAPLSGGVAHPELRCRTQTLLVLRCLEELEHPGEVVRVDELECVPVHSETHRIPEDLVRRGAGVAHGTVGPDDRDDDRRVVDQRAEPLLALPQRQLIRLLGGDVRRQLEHRGDRAVLVTHRRGGKADIDLVAPLGHAPRLGGLDHLAGHHAVAHVGGLLEVFLAHDTREPADHLGLGPTEDLLTRGVPEHDRAVAVERVDRDRSVLDDRAQCFVRAAQCVGDCSERLGRFRLAARLEDQVEFRDKSRLVLTGRSAETDRRGDFVSVRHSVPSGPC